MKLWLKLVDRIHLRRENGQGTTEYILIIAIIAIGLIAVFQLFRDEIEAMIESMIDAITGSW